MKMTKEVVQDELFHLFVKPLSYELSPMTGVPARCSQAGRVVPCFEPRCPGPAPRRRAFVFTDDLQRPATWLEHDTSMAALIRKWARPNEDLEKHSIKSYNYHNTNSNNCIRKPTLKSDWQSDERWTLC